MTSPPSYDASGPSLRLVLGVVGVLVVVLGVLAYWRFTISERHFAETLDHIDVIAPTLDTDGCVGAVLEWHGRCEANRPLCDDGVPRVMTHCLMGGDHTKFCDTLELGSAKAQWVFGMCQDRGTPCRDRKKCACADAYRTVDSYCRHGQKGVSL